MLHNQLRLLLNFKCDSSVNKSVLLALAIRSDENGTCWPSFSRLAEDTSLSIRSVQNAITELDQANAIIVKRVKGKGNKYSINYSTTCSSTECSSTECPTARAPDALPPSTTCPTPEHHVLSNGKGMVNEDINLNDDQDLFTGQPPLKPLQEIPRFDLTNWAASRPLIKFYRYDDPARAQFQHIGENTQAEVLAQAYSDVATDYEDRRRSGDQFVPKTMTVVDLAAKIEQLTKIKARLERMALKEQAPPKLISDEVLANFKSKKIGGE